MSVNLLRALGEKLSADGIESLAADWTARLDRGPLSGAEQVALESWLSADPRHHGAFVRAQAAMALLDGMAEAPSASPPKPSLHLSRRRLWLGGGAALAASVVGGAVLISGRERLQTVATGPGEIRRLAFPGGAEIVLDARSKVRTAMTGGRQVVSLDAGRAAFDMRRAPDEPLSVWAGELRLESSKAAFSAARQAEQVDLLVSEGRVEAWGESAPRAERLVLQGGEQATLMRASLVSRSRLSMDAVTRAEAWKSGRLALDGESVAQAVAVFNRYNDLQIVVASPELGRQTLVGYFYLNDPAGFTAALEASFDARSRRTGDRIVVE